MVNTRVLRMQKLFLKLLKQYGYVRTHIQNHSKENTSTRRSKWYNMWIWIYHAFIASSYLHYWLSASKRGRQQRAKLANKRTNTV